MKNSDYSIWKTIVEYRQNSIFTRFFSFILIILATVLIGVSISIFYSYNQSLDDERVTLNDKSIDRLKDVLDFMLTGSDDLSLRISQNLVIKDLLMKSQEGQWNSDTIEAINRTVKAISIHATDYIDEVGVYVYANKMFISSEGLIDIHYDASKDSWQSYVKQDLSPWGSFVYAESSDFNEDKDGEQGNNRVENLVMLRALTLNGKTKGIVFIRIGLDHIESFYDYDNTNTSDTIMIVDGDGTVKYANNKALLGNNIQGMDDFHKMKPDFATRYYRTENKKLLVSARMANYNDYVYLLAKSISLEEAQKKIVFVLIIIICVSIVVAMLLSAIMSYYMYRPFRYIIRRINNVGNMPLKDSVSELGELKYIVTRFMNNHKNQLDLTDQLHESMDQLKLAQTLALQSQINPHFLHNTLNDITIMALQLTGEENDVSKSIRNLSDMLRISFQSKDLLIPVSVELEHVRSYLDIEKMRYPGKFSVTWEIEEDILDCVMVKTVLQPLVENAIHHGLKDKRKDGVITIKGERSMDHMMFWVKDNGGGMEPKQLDALMNAIASRHIKFGSHIGIANVHTKIGIIFGADYGLTIKSQLGIGTDIQVTLPAIKNE